MSDMREDGPAEPDFAPTGAGGARPENDDPYGAATVAASGRAPGDPQSRSVPDQTAPRLANYEIIGKLGEGGMGVVYEAEQKSPRRRVALKVIRGGQFVDENRVRMFQREAQSLARLEHPNIGAIYESGRTEDGHHYFAMELVPGSTLGEYLAARATPKGLTGEELRFRLELFREIGDAVHYAHQRGVIHRDLKPSNIVVRDAAGNDPGSSRVGMPTVKILDFGLARITDGDVQATILSEVGTVKGTLPYMSPEQARGNPEEIDLRADVFSLGVLLFEMLSGSLPRDTASGSMLDALRSVAEGEIRPLREVFRGTIRLDPDVATICHKALALDPAERYASAAAFTEDVERFLSGLPIQARPASTLYQIRKMVARNRLGTAFAATVVLGLVALAVTMSVLRSSADQARTEAQARTAELERVTAFQGSMLSELDVEKMGRELYADITERVATSLDSTGVAAAEPELRRFGETLGRTNPTDVALRLLDDQVLKRALSTIDADFAEQPLVRAELLETVGSTYRELGMFPAALPLLQESVDTRRRLLGEGHPRTIRALSSLAWLQTDMGLYEEAVAAYRSVLEGWQRLHGEDHSEVVLARLAVGFALNETGRYEEALPYMRAGVDGARRVLGPEDPQTLKGIGNLGALLVRSGDIEAGAPLLQEALSIRRRTLGDDHPQTLMSIYNLSQLFLQSDRLDEALALGREALEGRQRTLGGDHPSTWMAMGSVGQILEAKGEKAEALGYLEAARAGLVATLGQDHWITLEATRGVANLHVEMGRPGEALAVLDAMEKDARRVFVEGNRPRLGSFFITRGRSRTALGDFAAAEADFQQALEVLGDPLPADKRAQRLRTVLVELYERWHAENPTGGYDAKAAEWRERRDKAAPPS